MALLDLHVPKCVSSATCHSTSPEAVNVDGMFSRPWTAVVATNDTKTTASTTAIFSIAHRIQYSVAS